MGNPSSIVGVCIPQPAMMNNRISDAELPGVGSLPAVNTQYATVAECSCPEMGD